MTRYKRIDNAMSKNNEDLIEMRRKRACIIGLMDQLLLLDLLHYWVWSEKHVNEGLIRICGMEWVAKECLVLGVIEDSKDSLCVSQYHLQRRKDEKDESRDEDENDILLLFFEPLVRLLWLGLVFTRGG
ncbi:hypothetical protein OCU04_007460 [Sclerotinia nivalis]|uniref:Uncharacterized protein n=1 Tax=Sclerotinia nivalis TaxID=352851 RepID=A0A9X0AIT8_9HELO|nr:hypothetical protein OCU04_007460 [Sclerotinia nivalis]